MPTLTISSVRKIRRKRRLRMTIKISISLSEAEQKLALFLAKKRYENARSKNITDNKIGSQSNYETDLEGMAAEIAAARLLNLYPDLQIVNIPTFDLMTNKGHTVDVKVTKYPNGKLLAVKGKIKYPCDFYMLMIGQCPNYHCAGFASGEDLLSVDTLSDLGRGTGHALSQDKLMPFTEWDKIFN
jgi:hypothetical protein